MDRRRQQRLSLDLLRGFRAAARHLSFTRAAHELFVAQPAISREVRTLEEQLGQPLFRRVNRTNVVRKFVGWLHAEVRCDGRLALSPPAGHRRPRRRSAASDDALIEAG
jgi:hypothetical protein